MTTIIRRLFLLSSALAKRGKRFHNLKMVLPTKRSPTGRFVYSFRYRIGEYALRSFMALLPWIPYRWLALFTSLMARFAFMFLWKYRSRMEANVENALGDQIADPAERKALVRRAWNQLRSGRARHDGGRCICPRSGSPRPLRIEGEEHLKRALAKGKGVIALSAHLGAFTMIGARLAAAGYPFSVVVKHPRDERMARVMNDLRAQIGISTISAKPRQEAVRGILKALRK